MAIGILLAFVLEDTIPRSTYARYLWDKTLASPDGQMPQTLQMLMSNVVFDGFTVLATFWILTLAVGLNRKLTIPLAISLDVLVAALLACASLYFGLIFTDKALSLKEVAHVLVGLSPQGTHYDIGPYFWAMHTTFLPTVFYLCLILLCWMAKILVLPIAKVLSKGAVVDKPHHLTAGVFFLLAAIFGALAMGIDRVQESTSAHTQITQPRDYPVSIPAGAINAISTHGQPVRPGLKTQ